MQRKIQQLSPANRLKVTVFLYWLHLSEIVKPITSQISPNTLRLITSFLALVIMSIVVAKDHLLTGTLLALLYSSLFATYTLYSMLRLRLARQRVHWVGE